MPGTLRCTVIYGTVTSLLSDFNFDSYLCNILWMDYKLTSLFCRRQHSVHEFTCKIKYWPTQIHVFLQTCLRFEEYCSLACEVRVSFNFTNISVKSCCFHLLSWTWESRFFRNNPNSYQTTLLHTPETKMHSHLRQKLKSFLIRYKVGKSLSKFIVYYI